MKKVTLLALVAVLAISSLALAAPKTAPVRAPENASASGNFVAATKPFPRKLIINADTMGVTSFDWMHNGPMGAQVVADQIGGLHFGWTYRNLAGTAGSRFPAYNHYDASAGWLGETNASTNGVGRWGTVGCKPTGEGLFAFYFTSGTNYPNMIAVDAMPGVGLFDNYAIDTIPTPDGYAHPYLAVASPETMYVVSDGLLDEAMFNYSYDGGVTWGTWADAGAGDPEGFNFPCYNIAAQHNKVAICHLDTFSNIVYKESFDYGATWNAYRVAIAGGAITSDGDTIVPYITGPVCFYDADGKLIIAGNYYQYTDDTTGTVPYDNGIAVWDSVNGLKIAATQTITAPTGWDQIGGTNTLACEWPWIAQSGSGKLVISYTQFDIADTAANGCANGDVFIVTSDDNGATWNSKINVTNSPALGAALGEAEDDRYPGCTIVGDTIHFAWLCSKNAGSSFYDGELATSMDPMLHYSMILNGVEGNTERTPASRFALNQSNPNPARSIASISFSLPQAGNYSLKIYNIAGQVIRTLDGQGAAGQNTVTWNGMDNNNRKVANGVYLYNLNACGKSATKKLVVVR